MVTTYIYDPKGSVILRTCDPGGYLRYAPDSPLKWDLPDSTHVGSVNGPDNAIALTVWLSVYDGVIDHAAYDLAIAPGLPQEARDLCKSIEGARVEEIVTQYGQCAVVQSNEVMGAEWPPADLAKAALAAALAHPKSSAGYGSDGPNAPQIDGPA